ncbi:MAG: hypothetical protein VX705_11120 [Verrucomicrobiota bacterium]|nr:hypothetical protein [Verrucomicrobiota bacterium]
MTPLPTQSSPAESAAADPLMGLVAPVESSTDNRGFETVFREAADEAKAAEQEKTEEKREKTDAKTDAKAGSKESETKPNGRATNSKTFAELTGLGRATPLQKASVQATKVEGKAAAQGGDSKAKLAQIQTANEGQGAKELARETKASGRVVGDSKAEVKTEAKSDAAAQQANQPNRQALRLKKQKAARAQLKAEDTKRAEAKAQLESARQNLPTLALAQGMKAKGAAPGMAGLAGKNGAPLPEGQWELVNGTQIAQNNPKMAMMAKSTALVPDNTVAKWEELRPATGAELGSGASGQQQDLPREQARDLAPVQAATALPAATGTAPAQALAPAPGQISPILEKIWNAVTTFRARGADQWTVKVQPDNHTQMELSIRYSQAGLEIQARLGQGDNSQLAGQWGELQQSLAERGVTLRDLAQNEADFARFSGNLDDFSSSQSRRHAPAGEEDDGPLDWHDREGSRESEEDTAPRRVPAKAEDATWESWA